MCFFRFPIQGFYLLILLPLVFCVGCKKDEKVTEPPQVVTLKGLFLSPGRALIKGSLKNSGNVQVDDHGFVYSLNEYFRPDNTDTISLGESSANGEFSHEIDSMPYSGNLYEKDVLYVKAYYRNKSETQYGEVGKILLPQVYIQNISPRKGMSGDLVTLKGQFYVSKSKKVELMVGGIKTLSITQNDSLITFAIPSGIAKRHRESLYIYLVIDGEVIFVDNSFEILAHVKDFYPKSGPVGTVIHFQGDNLPANYSTVSDIEISVGGVSTINNAETDLIAVAPESRIVQSPVTLKVSGLETTLAERFTYTAPVITSVSPLSMMAGGVLTIRGSNMPLDATVTYPRLKIGNTVTWGSYYDGNVIINTPYELMPGKYALSFLSGPHTINLSEELTINPYEMFSFSPSSGFPLTKVIIKGTFNRFQEYWVYFNDKRAKGTAISNSELEVQAPVGNHGEQCAVTVQMVGGQMYTVPGTFKMIGPVITSFSPKSGAPGTEFTIKGDNFRWQFGASVTMGANFGFSNIVDEQTIKVTIPNYATPGSGKLSVTINGQEALTTEVFTVLPK